MVFFTDSKKGVDIFKNEDALDPEWIPKVLPYRGEQQKVIADCIRLLLQNRNGRNIFVYGSPGIGKTAATKWVLRDLENHTDDVYVLYINCWQKNTTYKIYLELCSQLGYSFVQNKNSEELFKVIQGILNKKTAVFVFDEIDKIEDPDFLYSILNDIYKKSIILLTNYPAWLSKVEDRIKSRLMAEKLEFKPYNSFEVEGILRERIDYAFLPDTWDKIALSLVVEKALEAGDVRVGLHLLKEAGRAAEISFSGKVFDEHVFRAVETLSGFHVKEKEALDDDSQKILDLVQGTNKIGDVFDEYQKSGGKGTYKTFQRKIDKLSKANFINTKKVIGGKDGTTTLVAEKNKTLDDFE
jgi:archaeal cell division control protein 6